MRSSDRGCANENKGAVLGGVDTNTIPAAAKTNKTKRKEDTKMNGTVMQAVLWILAGFFLTLLIIRRGRRKARG